MRIGLSAFLALLPTVAFSQEPVQAALAGTFWEIERPAAEISGARIMGFGAVGPIASLDDPLTVRADIPADWLEDSDEVCLSVTSADSLYESRNSYKLESSGPTTLPYPTEKLTLLRDRAPDSLAPLLTKGSCDAQGNTAAPITPVRIGPSDERPLLLLLNTSRAEETFLMFDEFAATGEILCDLPDIPVRNAFDTSCTIPAGVTGAVTASYLSFHRGEMGREEHRTLLIPERAR